MISLYIKTHNTTGMKYLGKTTRNPFKYRGSGKLWLRHLRKYGNDVTTEVVAEFEDQLECTEFAVRLSKDLNVVASDQWANLIEENGLDGAPVGHKGHDFTKVQRIRMSKASSERWKDPDYRSRMSIIHKVRWELVDRETLNTPWSGVKREDHSRTMIQLYKDEPWRKEQLSVAMKGIPKTDEHKGAISKSLIGKAKSPEHRMAIAMQRITKYNPSCQFNDYTDLRREALKLRESGKSVAEISRLLNISWNAAKSVISNSYLLKEE